jgi:hypothetical protein
VQRVSPYLRLGGGGAHCADGVEIGQVRVDHVHHIDVVEEFDPHRLGLAEQVRDQRLFGDDELFVDVLRAIDHVDG